MGLVAWLFVFVAGGISALALAVYLIMTAIGKVEEMAENSYKDMGKVTTERYEEMKRIQNERQEKSLSNATSAKDHQEPDTWVKLLKEGEEDSKAKPWNWILLKSNMLFRFLDQQSGGVKDVILLDGCSITVSLFRKPNKPLWKANNTIILTNSQRNLLQESNSKSIQILFKTAKDLEEWYYLLQKATQLTTKKMSVEEAANAEYWRGLVKNIPCNVVDKDPSWLTPILSRILWNVLGSEGLVYFITQKLTKRINQVKKPSFVEEIIIKEFYLGPNLPLLKDAELLYLDEHGKLEASAYVVYTGGFRLTLEIHFLVKLPTKHVLKLPAQISVHVKHAEGKLKLHCAGPPSECFWIGFFSEPTVELDIDTQIGENRKISNLPKLAKILVYKIKQELIELMVLPNMDDWPIPKFPSRAKQEEKKEIKEELEAKHMETPKRDSPNASVDPNQIDEEILTMIEGETSKDPITKKTQ